MIVGVTIAAYSLNDKAGVGEVEPITYMLGMLVVENACLTPLFWLWRRVLMLELPQIVCQFLVWLLPNSPVALGSNSRNKL